MTPGVRLDRLLVQLGLVRSRSQARRLILEGKIEVEGRPVTKPGQEVDPEARVQLPEIHDLYVGRGGDKLEGVLSDIGLSVANLHCLDVGASTGGFTQCLLRRGARSVVAIDVGRDQLAPSLRDHPRVTYFEGLDVRDAVPAEIGAPFDLAVVDVSFISLTLVLAPLRDMLGREAPALVLVKPQFELGPGGAGRRGVVRDPRARARAVNRVSAAAEEIGFRVLETAESRVRGSRGNLEVFLYLKKSAREAR